VYDALNVLMAMDIISKEKKEIQWKGLPSTDIDDVESLKVRTVYINPVSDILYIFSRNIAGV
jgi:hypothetical protein